MIPLLVFTQPRDIPQFVAVEKEQGRKYDRLFIKYTPHVDAYAACRYHFLRNKEYTHYIYCTDDLLFANEALDRLIVDYNTYFKDVDDICVLAADMNLDTEEPWRRGFILAKNALPDLTSKEPLQFKDYKFCNKAVAAMYADQHGLVKCSWSALPLAIIPRHIIEHTTFHNDFQYKKMPYPPEQGCCIDVIFAQECNDQGFSIYTDLNVEAKHLKTSVLKNEYYAEYMQVGKKRPEWFILRADTNERIDIL